MMTYVTDKSTASTVLCVNIFGCIVRCQTKGVCVRLVCQPCCGAVLGDMWVWAQFWGSASLGEDEAGKRKDCWQHWRLLEDKTLSSANAAGCCVCGDSSKTNAHTRTGTDTDTHNQSGRHKCALEPLTKYPSTLSHTDRLTSWDWIQTSK